MSGTVENLLPDTFLYKYKNQNIVAVGGWAVGTPSCTEFSCGRLKNSSVTINGQRNAWVGGRITYMGGTIETEFSNC